MKNISLFIFCFFVLFSIFLLWLTKNPSKKEAVQENPSEEITPPQNEISENLITEIQRFQITPPQNEILWLYPQTKYSLENIQEFSQKTNILIPQNILRVIDWKDYNLFSCSEGRGIRLTQTNNQKISYEEILASLDTWSPSMPENLWFIYFETPQESNTSSVKQKNNTYIEDENYEWQYKTLEVSLRKGGIKTLYYGTIAYNIVITDSLSCAQSVSSGIYDLVP
ncbi:MAG: hypothetical protein EOM19_02555 [Candidatus Moranbacteria bacterium]|nr:hypothetical protein [Candidatus Moranbacteria bacterium]